MADHTTVSIEGDGWVLRPERAEDAAEIARAFAEFVVVDDVVPRGSGTEAFGWFSSITMAGSAAGALAAGELMDANGARTATLAIVAAGAVCVLVAAVCRRPLATRISPELTR